LGIDPQIFVNLPLKLSNFVGWTFRKKLKVPFILGKDSGSEFRERPVHPLQLLDGLIELYMVLNHGVTA